MPKERRSPNAGIASHGEDDRLSGLTIQGLTKAFGGTLAVKSIDLDVAEGEFVSLLGPSGCGKTTTLRCVAGLDEPTGGRILFGDRDVTWVQTRNRMIGMVFQNYALFPHMTVAENIGFGLDMRGVRGREAAQRIAGMVDTVQLTGLEQRYPRELSGGQQQRVALARALVVEPALLLLDEPLANLDAKLRDEMRFFIRSLQQRVGITTLYVTHDQSESMVMSDRIVVMFGGRIHQVGGPEDIYYRPASREVANFIGQANLIEATVVAAQDGVALIEAVAGQFRCGTSGAVTAGEPVTAMVRPEALRICDGADQPDFRGRIVAAHFLGNVIEYRIALTDGNVVSMQAINGVTHAVDSPVSLRVDQNKAWLLR
jgi:putative spermidine/putrescine transport system ATP-binding protein